MGQTIINPERQKRKAAMRQYAFRTMKAYQKWAKKLRIEERLANQKPKASQAEAQ